MKRTFSIVAVFALLVLCFIAGSCGGGFATNGNLDGTNAGFLGINEGGFKAIRYNDAGYADPSLNRSMDLAVENKGDQTVVRVAIDDNQESIGVMLDLGYDAGKYHPVNVEFQGLVATPLELAVTGVPGTVGLGQVGNAVKGRFTGAFAVVTFKNEAFGKTASAVSGVYTMASLNNNYPALFGAPARDGFTMTDASTADGDDATFDLYSTFALGDGNADGQTLVSDLAVIGQIGIDATVSATNLVPAIGDFNFDGKVSVQDLTVIGQNFQHGYTGIEVLLGDSATFSESDTALTTIDRASGSTPTTSFGTPNLDWTQIFRNWTGGVTAVQAAAADANGDGTVFLSLRAVDANGPTGAQKGPAFPGVAIAANLPLPAQVVIDDFTLAIDGATGGTGAENNVFASGSTASVIANSTLNIYVEGITGAYQGNPFTPADAGTAVIPQNVYDQALASVQSSATFTPADAGEAEMKQTAPVIVIGDFNGEGRDAVVFPDDDPESAGATSEADLTAVLPASGVGIPAAINKSIKVDVDLDPNVPVFTEYNTVEGQDGNGDWLLSAGASTHVNVKMHFGASGAPATLDGSTLQASLFDLNNQTEELLTFAATPSDPLEFTVREVADPDYGMEAVISPNDVIAGHLYSLRLRVVTLGYNSVNKPGQWLTLGALPPAQELQILPHDGQIDKDISAITVFYTDPKIRRHGGVFFDLNNNGAVTPSDTDNYGDILKGNGDEFTWQSPDQGSGPWPEVTFLETSNPADIDATTVGIAGPIMQSTNYDAGKVVINIDAIDKPASIGQTKTYSFKLFGKPTTAGNQATRPELGFGTFTIEFSLPSLGGISGTDFGLNIFDGPGRGSKLMGDEDYSDKTISLGTFGATTDDPGAPDVLWVRWAGGVTGNVNAVITDHDNPGGSETLPLNVRIVGLGANGLEMIGTYVFSDVDKVGSPSGGVLLNGSFYDISLQDGVNPNYTFATTLGCGL